MTIEHDGVVYDVDGKAPHAFISFGDPPGDPICAVFRCASDGTDVPASRRDHPIHQIGFFARLRLLLGGGAK